MREGKPEHSAFSGPAIANDGFAADFAPGFQSNDTQMPILGVPISITSLPRAVDVLLDWANERRSASVFLRDVHGVMRSRQDPDLLACHRDADLVLPDGMPLVWIGRFRGYGKRIGRVSGYDLVGELCRRSIEHRIKHYFYGGQPGVADTMAKILSERYPGLLVAGIYSPPMRSISADRPLNEQEILEIDTIERSGAQIIWVGISTPKQEFWITKARQHTKSGVFLGVGAAFDYHAGSVNRAPVWMRSNGLEWLHRLLSEPRRLWRRYLVLAPKFVALEAVEECRRWLERKNRVNGPEKRHRPTDHRDV